MQRLRALNWFQKILLLALAAMAVVFTVLYPIVIARVGYLYYDTILVAKPENGGTVYAGKIQGEPACFTVSADKTVTFRYGDRSYGPYTAREDPDAIPEEAPFAPEMTGVALYCGEELLFRGGVLDAGESLWLYNANGSIHDIGISMTVGDGTIMTVDGEGMDSMEPSAATLLDLMNGPDLNHKGSWGIWFGALLIGILTAVSILFADDLFLWRMSFWVRDPDRVEPSDWEILSRHIGWSILVIMTLAFFIMGLQ